MNKSYKKKKLEAISKILKGEKVDKIKRTKLKEFDDYSLLIQKILERISIIEGPPGKTGEPGYTPVKGKDYFDGKNPKDGYTPIKGKDYFDGKSIKGPKGEKGDSIKGEDGKTPIKGVDYKDGIDGKSVKGPKGDTPIVDIKAIKKEVTPIKGIDYKDGKDAKPVDENKLIERLKGALESLFDEELGEKEKEILKKLELKLTQMVQRLQVYGGGGDGGLTEQEIINLIEETVAGTYALQLDEVGSISYLGKAVPGSATNAAVWQIQKIDESGDPELIITWASGNKLFNKIWDDRAGLSYS